MNDQMNSGHAVSRYKRFRDETVEMVQNAENPY